MNAFHALYWNIILITALNSKVSLLRKEDYQNIWKYTKKKLNYTFLTILENMVNISLPDFF